MAPNEPDQQFLQAELDWFKGHAPAETSLRIPLLFMENCFHKKGATPDKRVVFKYAGPDEVLNVVYKIAKTNQAVL